MAMNVGPSGSGDSEVMVDINTTPLIDVMLVLLIMFIITIPIQTHAVKLNMPTPSNVQPTKLPDVMRIDGLLTASQIPLERSRCWWHTCGP